MPNAIDLSGQRFGKLVAQEPVYVGKTRSWRCLCDCGCEAVVTTTNLRTGNSRSCRSCCMDNNNNAKKHGGRPKGQKSPTYNTWQSMKRRCTDKTRASAATYVLSGIGYDPRWERFENFVADMGERPKGYTLDRLNNSKGYSKENCRWATPTQQTRNRRIALQFTFEGRTKPIAEWAREFGITYGAAIARIKRHNSLRLPNDDVASSGVET